MACRRQIIYFTNYQRGEPAEKAGCAVIWIWEERCRLELLYRSGMLSGVTPVYCFLDGSRWEGEPLVLEQGEIRVEAETTVSDFLGSGKPAQELAAICFAGNCGCYGGGRADGARLTFLAESTPPYPAKQWVETVTRVVQTEAERTDRETTEAGRADEEPEEMKQSNPEQETDMPTAAGEMKPCSLKELLEALPPLTLPADGMREKCGKLSLEELGHLPEQWRGLRRNDFLLHGYYQYRHLLLARMREGGRSGYVLGVPGSFFYREQYMAESFGFLHFSPMKEGRRQRGEFGYWYRWLE